MLGLVPKTKRQHRAVRVIYEYPLKAPIFQDTIGNVKKEIVLD